MKTESPAADLMRREFFRAMPLSDDLDIFVLTEWEEIPETEQTAWINAFRFARQGEHNKVKILRKALIAIIGESDPKKLERMRSVIAGLKVLRNDDENADAAIAGINALLLTADQDI